MLLSYQVTNKKISQSLKDLGVPQDSMFYWQKGEILYTPERSEDEVSAFTVSELGELLPTVLYWNREMNIIEKDWMEDSMIQQNLWHESGKDSDGKYQSNYGSDGIAYIKFESDTEANARGEMIAYLRKNNLISSNEK